MTNQPKHLRPWSLVDDGELRLLRRLEELVRTRRVKFADTEAVLGMLEDHRR